MINVFFSSEKVRKMNGVVLIHCMAGISRSVTLTIAYLMAHFGMSMQDAYQYVKDKRPAISPNLNFMGQLVEFERELNRFPSAVTLDIHKYHSTDEQKLLSDKLMEKIIRTNSFTTIPLIESPKAKSDDTDSITTTSSSSGNQAQTPFILKPLSSKGRRIKKNRESLEIQQESVAPITMTTTSSSKQEVTEFSNPVDSNSLSSALSSLHVTNSSVQEANPGLPHVAGTGVVGEVMNLHDRVPSTGLPSTLS